MSLEAHIREAAQILETADALLVSAGAGMGVDSGLPDFRGNEGFWRAYPPIAKLGISFSEMANPQWFSRDPRLAWGFYGHRLNLYRKTAPHKGFSQLLELGNHKKGGYFVFTSNVDGHFQKAGYSEERVMECHGSIHHFQCVRPCCEAIWDAGNIRITVDDATFRAQEPLPHCPYCEALARPNVLMFGDWHWISHRTAAQEERFYGWLRTIQENSWRLAIVEAGAGTAVPTVRHTSENIAARLNGDLIRINLRDPEVPPGHISLPLSAAEGIGRLYNLIYH